MLDGLAPEKAINTSCPQTLEAYVVYVVAKTESKKQSVLGKQPQIRLFLLWQATATNDYGSVHLYFYALGLPMVAFFDFGGLSTQVAAI